MYPLTGSSLRPFPCLLILILASSAAIPAAPVLAQCPAEPPLQNFTGAGQTICPCFSVGERAGVVLQAPAEDYPLEILRVGIGWGSQFGGNPPQLEQAIQIYESGLPDPGNMIFELPGPQLTDGAINEYNLEPLPGDIIIDSGPFTVALEFMTANAGNIYAPTVVHDGNGCQSGKNVIFAKPGGWLDACGVGVTGDWVMYAVYRPCVTQVGVGDERIVSTAPVVLMPAQPNPFRAATTLEFYLDEPGATRVSVYDVVGRLVATLADRRFTEGTHRVTWDGRQSDGTPARAGMYFVRLVVGSHESMGKVVLTD